MVATIFSGAVEGLVDEAVVRKLVALAGGRTGEVYGRNGKQALRLRISGYNNAARRSPWVVLVDLENEADCAPPLRDEWVPAPAPNLCFRVVVRAVEAWLMADGPTLARYLGVRLARIPEAPETVDNPKDSMVALARQSRRKRHPPRHGATGQERSAGGSGVHIQAHQVRQGTLAARCGSGALREPSACYRLPAETRRYRR